MQRVVRKWIAILMLLVATYAHADPPDQKLAEAGVVLPKGSTLAEWESDGGAQFRMPAGAVGAVAASIDEILRKVLGCPAGYHVSVHMEK